MRRLLPLASLALLLVAGPAAAAEEILSYHSDIQVHEDGWLTVTETIRVRAEGKEIRRGIYRDFPVRYTGRGFRRVVVPFEVVRVERDDRPEAYHTSSEGDSLRIYAGKKNVRLAPGVYTYKLTYRVGRMLGYFDEHDELYFNVTGNEWAFPIGRTSASVKLPKGVPAGSIKGEAYTGEKGAKGRAYRSAVDQNGRITFETTAPLGRGEGLTIVVTWPKGHVHEPTGWEKAKYFFADNGMVAAGAVGLVVVAVYFFLAWMRIGRDPARGLVIPLFEPSAGLCPASLRYVLRMGFDKTCFAATVISLAVKRKLTIEDDDGDYSLLRADTGEDGDLSRGEKKVLSRLLKGRQDIELDNRHHATFRKAIAGLKDVLAEQYQGRYFFSNIKWFIPGVILSVLTLAAVGVTSFLILGDPTVAFLTVWLTGWSFGVFFLVRQVLILWKGVMAGRGGGAVVKSGGALFMTLFAVPFCIAEVVVLGVLVYQTSIYLLPVLLALGWLNVRFYHLLKRPTPEGRAVMDQIEGFKMYLATAEQDLLNAATPPEKTPELFEQYLPYALALDVANAWSEKFADVLARAASADGGAYHPGWYHGAAWGALGAAAFTSSFGQSFSSALSSASTAPGSSSGSGGGGSSGGGGGGGGGGGW